MTRRTRPPQNLNLGRVAVLDTNILLLYLASKTQPPMWSWKRVQEFDADDALLLGRLLGQFEALATTPHVLTEVSNFANQLHGLHRQLILQQLSLYASRNLEHYRASVSLTEHPEFIPLGITDCALCDLDPESTVITTDFRLSARLGVTGKSVVNFNHLRQSRLLP